ncbi:hypothetical protein DD237_008332 [Peronospora effusa]|uniref:Reverse transcriptase zinc-binding domain-containing protein n=1 Tax=Peronospora effusa TaxID=542832 RepID=A0A425C2R1_9STRA|nr:hypothetical protein DD237_008332 [Peronospora effusa]
MLVEPQRSFRLHVSRVFRVRSLADFMRDGDFVQRHIDFTLGSVLPGRQAHWLRVLYVEATQIVARLGATHMVLHPESSRRHPLPYLGCSSGDKVCFMPSIPKSALLRIVWSPQPPTKQHPMTIHSQRIDVGMIRNYVKYSKHLQKIMLPVFADLQFRLAFRLLPVRSRFWFLEAANPSIRLCVRVGCGTIETEQHLFFDCTLAVQLWEHAHRLMSPFFRLRATWLDIVLLTKLHVRDEWMASAEVVYDVWHTLRAVALHFLWTNRSRCLFDGKQPTPVLPAMQIILTSASAHFRHRLRRCYDLDQRTRQQALLAWMSRNRLFHDFISQKPTVIKVCERKLHPQERLSTVMV